MPPVQPDRHRIALVGRPVVTLSFEQVRKVETLAALLFVQQIADYLGISRNTFRAICRRDAEVSARYKRGKVKAIAHVANSLLQKARAGDATCAIFYLKTQSGWRETIQFEELEVRETTGARERLAAFLDNKTRDVPLQPAALSPGDGRKTGVS